MEDLYRIRDLHQYMNRQPIFTAIPPPPSPPPPPPPLPPPQGLLLSSFSSHHHHHINQQAQYHDMVMGNGLMFCGDLSNSTANSNTAVGGSTSASGGGGDLEVEVGGGIGGGGDGDGGGGGNGRWPRQETMTLLEVRSRLDYKFKEANQKAPLWDEVSRIMFEEHGYQRSGKKCREKFENLYKYYKKTKEGKAGRQDGKHYRFFRQLEALYGETSNNPSSLVSKNAHLVGPNFQPPYPYQEAYHQAPSLSNNSSDFDHTSSSEYTDLNVATTTLMECNDLYDKMKKRKGKSKWKAKIREFVDSQMRKLVEKQEEWLEKMMRTMEQSDQDRIFREEEWRKQEVDRVDREQKFWANERASIEARDGAFMEALSKLSGKELVKASNAPQCENQSEENILSNWQEMEITRLIQLRTSMEQKFEQNRGLEEVLWEEIGEKMARLGDHKNGLMCKAKWDSINDYLTKSKKPNENSRSSLNLNHQSNETMIAHQGVTYWENIERYAPSDHQHGASPTNTMAPDNCFRFFMGEAENVWGSYGVKLTRGENH